MKVLLVINGHPPKEMPNVRDYEKIYCTDGAYSYLLSQKIRPDFVIGDFDSVSIDDISPFVEAVEILDQDSTDFDKSLQFIVDQGHKEVDVYGSTGLEHDHFLGNLSTALSFKNKIEITFFDDYSVFFFTDKSITLDNVKNRVISLVPFHEAKNVHSKGLKYPLIGMDLKLGKRIGTRNIADEDIVEISYDAGELMIFISVYDKEEEDEWK